MAQLIRPVFTLDLGAKLIPGRVTVGKYDGSHSCLTVATTADKVLIHSPHRRSNSMQVGRVMWSESNKEIAVLNLNQSIVALKAGKLLPEDDKDVLLVGTPTHLLAYHVHDNRDIFYRECEDGAHALVIGRLNDALRQVAVVGGLSTVRVIDHQGNELWWTTVGEKVTGLTILDYNRDGFNELIASTEDYNIRVYKSEKLIAEQTETEMVTGLEDLYDNRYAYSVSNGTIGVYEQDTRLWRVKSKNFAVGMCSYDLIGLGNRQLITVWSNGKIDCRSINTGEVLFKDSLLHPAAGLIEADYRGTGKTELVCISVEGEVRGYTTTKLASAVQGSNTDQELIRDLLQQKQNLLLELRHYENNSKFNNEEDVPELNEDVGIIPANTRLQIGISANEEDPKPHVEIAISTNNETIIKAVAVFAEGIFKGETMVVHPPESKVANRLSVPLLPPKDIPVDIHIKALVGHKTSKQFHVFELTKQIPRFSMYTVTQKLLQKPDSYVKFKINERIQRICLWINQNFLLDNDVEPMGEPDLKIQLKSLRDKNHVVFTFDITGQVTIYTDNMLLASDLVRSLANFLNLDHLQSTANFRNDEDKLKNLMESLNEIQESRFRLGTDVADRLGQIRGLVIKAEDSRINAINEMAQYYVELFNINRELINGYNIRLTNYNEGVDALKEINKIIQMASRLRVGKYSASMINNCRTAIKNNNIEALIKILRTGEN